LPCFKRRKITILTFFYHIILSLSFNIFLSFNIIIAQFPRFPSSKNPFARQLYRKVFEISKFSKFQNFQKKFSKFLHGNYIEKCLRFQNLMHESLMKDDKRIFCLQIQLWTSFHFLMRFRSFSTARCHILRKRLNSLHFVIKWPLSIIFIRCYRSILRCNNQVINWLYD